MKHRSVACIAFVVLTAGAQPRSPEVTPDQMNEYKMKTAAACIADAAAEQVEGTRARSFCNCTTEYVWSAMPLAELQLAYHHSIQNAHREELTLLAPYIRRAAKECKASLGL